jgi:sulfite exporter TauE/SafE
MEKFIVLSKADLDWRINQLPLSADAKAILSQISETSAKVGERVIYVGRHVLTFIFDLVRQFPNTTFGGIAGFAISSLIASIPFVGAVLAAFLGPLLIALGIARGAVADMANSAIASRVAAFETQLRGLDVGAH